MKRTRAALALPAFAVAETAGSYWIASGWRFMIESLWNNANGRVVPDPFGIAS